MDLGQEIADRLVTAVQEQDVLFTLFWINEARKERLLDAVIERRHSSKKCTALESIAKSSFSQLRHVLLQVLLLSGADTRIRDTLDLAADCQNRQVVELLEGWNTVDREDLKVPLRLLSLPLAEAGDVIDSTLPAPPNAATLTGYNPLPTPSLAPPAAVERDVTPPLIQAVETPEPSPPPSRESPRPRSERKRSFSARASPEPSIPRPQSPSVSRPKRSAPPSIERSPRPTRDRRRRHDSPEEDRSRSKSRLGSPRIRPRLVLDSTNCVRVNVARFPVGWNGLDLQAMFEDIGVPSKPILCHSTYWPTYAFLDVDRDDANRCIRLLEGTMQGDARIRVNFAGRQHNSFRGDPTRPQIPSRPDSSPHRPSYPSRFPPPPSRSDASHRQFSPPATSSNSIVTGEYRGPTRNVMIVNLPYDETDEARIVVNKLRYFDLHRLAEYDQAVAWFQDTQRGDHLVKLWDDYVVDGKRLKVVFAKEGLSAVEAIEGYLRDSRTAAGGGGGGGGGGGKSSRSHRARSRSRSERSRSHRRSRSPSVVTKTDRYDDDDDRDERDDRSSRSRKSSTKRSKRSSRRSRSRSVESNTSYGPSPPPLDVQGVNRYAATSGGGRTSSSLARNSTTRYKPSSTPSSSSRRHRERRARS